MKSAPAVAVSSLNVVVVNNTIEVNLLFEMRKDYIFIKINAITDQFEHFE